MNPAPQASRADLYRLLAMIFDFPSPELHEALSSGELQYALSEIQDLLETEGGDVPRISGGYQDLESSYIATFDLGSDEKPAISLRESAYVDAEEIQTLVPADEGTPAGLMQDLLRFYHHFGLHITAEPGKRLLPDHLCCQMEMLAFLCARESEPGADAEAGESCRRAQRDFLQRHVQRWLPRFTHALQQKAPATEAEAFYRAAAGVALSSVSAHARALS